MVVRRRSGAAARGSMRRASPRSRVVTETNTSTSPAGAISARRSMSRSTSADLVTIESGCRQMLRTSMISRVIR